MGVLGKDPPASNADAHDVHSILGPESSFDGKLTFRGSVRIDGPFVGVSKADGHLILGQDAVVKADARVGHLVVFGEMEGDLEAREGIEIHTSAKVRGKVISPQKMIGKGASFDGSCSMGRSAGGAGKAAEVAPMSSLGTTEVHVTH